ncbi:hypothetical protein AaE_005600, partial [Aphanomyces astaci]
PQMMAAGGFSSLFPIQELSVMGLVEVLPKLFAIKRHHDHVVEDIRQSQPDAVVTIDSKGFCFRVLKSLQGITNRMDHRRPAIVHYVAPSIWAFKHKHRNAASTAQSLGLFIDHMLVLLPFEARLFNHYRTWTTFVGHPSVETFMDAHDLFRRHDLLSSVVPPSITTELESLSMTSEWLQPEAPALWPMQTAIVHARRHHPRQRRTDEFAIAALVGSREDEVKQTIDLVKRAVESFASQHNTRVRVVFPTIPSVAHVLRKHLDSWAIPHAIHVQVQANTALLQASDVAVAVSGTVVIESLLAGTPTVVMYRANWLTEVIAAAVARVRFVSLPNILFDRELVPELVFSKCTSASLAHALSKAFNTPARSSSHANDDDVLVSAALSQLAVWKSDETSTTPCRASDIAAEVVVREMDKITASASSI